MLKSGRNGVNAYWSKWCMHHPTEWRTFVESSDLLPEEEKQCWIVELHSSQLQNVNNGELEAPKSKRG
jgi:hypothetical protein